MRRFKLSRSQMHQYIENKNLVNIHFAKVMKKVRIILQTKEIKYSIHSPQEIHDEGVKKFIFTTYYVGDHKQRISSHKKKNEFYDMENGLLFTKRNLQFSIGENVKKILKYLGVTND